MENDQEEDLKKVTGQYQRRWLFWSADNYTTSE